MIYGGVGTPTAQHSKPLRQQDNVGVGTPSPCIFSYVNVHCLNTLHSSLTDCKSTESHSTPKHWP